jgi:hypothetical protein
MLAAATIEEVTAATILAGLAAALLYAAARWRERRDA